MIHKVCEVTAADNGRELVQHGSAWFPIACYEEDLNDYTVPWHWHEDFEYILVVEGCLTVGVNKTRLHLQKGQGMFINSGVLHAVDRAKDPPALLRSGVFHPRLVGGMDTVFWQNSVKPLQDPGAPPCFLLEESTPWQRKVLDDLRESWETIYQEPEDYENRTRYLLSAALRQIAAHCQTQRDPTSRQEQIAAERMKQMLRFVEEHCAEELTVEKIAGCVALSESACLRSFRQILGITPIQYVKQYRVERAAELLGTTRMKIGEVGAECGFPDGSYFIRTFRELKHCTPKEYRQRLSARAEMRKDPEKPGENET